MDATVQVAFVSVVGSIIVAVISYIANRQGAKDASETNAKLVVYRLQELERKQERFNNLIERTFRLEGRVTALEQDVQDIKKGA